MSTEKPPVAIDFGKIKEPFDNFVRATGNRIERQWPKSISQHDASNATILGLYRAAENSFWTTRFVLADKPENPSRKLEFSLATAPLIRAQLETLAAVVYIFADLKGRTLEFLHAGWREGVRDTDRIRAARGNDPSWKSVIDQNTENLKRLYMPLGISRKQANDVVRQIKPWPLVGSMSAKLTGPRKDYIAYLDDWYYKALSQEAHPTWSGIGQTLSLLDRRLDTGDQRHQLELYRSKQIAASLTFMLALAMELDRELAFNQSAGARFAWSVLVDADPDVKDFYDTLYRPTLGPADMPLNTQGPI